ncbi:alpha/beta hydrolase [Neptuniibacter halophilus]|uniref:alpha/beta hydrolase n=1 Tax=Neptuniibacter halophilus TaxID=651666 RepID=UPI0025729378|nr:alpha/beta hydrolase [Neptuniibacter halophilus]
MQRFDRDILIRGLANFTEAGSGVPSESVRAYLATYHLLDLVAGAEYRIGRICLDDTWVTLQFYGQKTGQGSRGTVVILHGYMDHVGLYQRLIHDLHRQGYDLLCYDLSGHGLSDGDALAVDDFQHYASQLAELLTCLQSTLVHPVHLLGQSTGAAVIMAHQLLFSTQQMVPLGQRILLAPLVRPALWRSIRRKFRLLKYFLRRVPRRYSLNSHDKVFCRFISEQDPLQHRDIPVSWVGAMLAWGDWVEQHKPVPGGIHMIQGTGDGTVDWRHNMAVLGRLYPELDLLLIEEARHHLVNETAHYRDRVFNRIEQILQQWENENGQP